MKTEKEKIVLNTSNEAATFKTGISGWVDRHGRFFGNDEHMARWSGATHVVCSDCGKPVSKTWLVCADCRAKGGIDRYHKMPRKEWDGETPLYSHTADKYFSDADELTDHLEEFECTEESLRLIICEPIHLRQIDEDHFCGDLPEDGELPEDVLNALEDLNKVIKEQEPVGWTPGGYAAIMPDEGKNIETP